MEEITKRKLENLRALQQRQFLLPTMWKLQVSQFLVCLMPSHSCARAEVAPTISDVFAAGTETEEKRMLPTASV